MFGLAWSEIGLIGVVAMVLIGPKDMPVAIRAVSDAVKKARRMAGEFQGHVDDMLRDSNLSEVRDSIAEIRGMSTDLGGSILRAVDGDGAIRQTFADDPFKPASITTPKLDQIDVQALAESTHPVQGSVAFTPVPHRMEAPAFIPPAAVPPPPPESPAFVPPAAARAAQHPRA